MERKAVRFAVNNSINSFIEGSLAIPENPIRIVVFAHGSASSKNSTRNNKIALTFNKMGLSTFLFNLLTTEENEMDLRAQKIGDKIPGLVLNKFNIGLLSERLVTITKWLVNNKSLPLKNIGYFGSSTGAAAALVAALNLSMFHEDTTNDSKIRAIVSRGGRTDLINDPEVLKQLNVPLLFVVGSKDNQVIKINKKTMREFNPKVETKIEIIEGASHLFEEEGKIEKVSEVAGDWFLKYL